MDNLLIEILSEENMNKAYKSVCANKCRAGGDEIPKPNVGKRKLGIPTVMDRIIQKQYSNF